MRSVSMAPSARRVAPHPRGSLSRDAPKLTRNVLPAIAVPPPPLHQLFAEANLERADLRDLSGVDDRLVRAVEHPLAVHGDFESHPLFDLVVPAHDPVEGCVDLLRVDFGEEPERP